MSTTALVLVALSAVLHVSWNLVAKGRATAGFFLVGNLLGASALLPILMASPVSLLELPPALFVLLMGTGVVQAGYCLALIQAYRAGELSIVYPLVRSLGPVFVVVGSYALGRGDALGSGVIFGIASILIGSVLLGASSARAMPGAPLIFGTIACCLIAAIGTALYTLIDDAGVRVLRDSAVFLTPASENTRGIMFVFPISYRPGILYAAIQGWGVCFFLALWVLPSRARRAEFTAALSPGQLRDASIFGLGGYGAYALVLIAMSFATDVSYIAGFRQLSVPLGAAVGVILLKERMDGLKILGLAILCVGLVLVGIG